MKGVKPSRSNATGLLGTYRVSDHSSNATAQPSMNAPAELQRTCRHHNTPRQPFDAICVTPCSIIASGTGIMASRMPTRIMPPAMPKMPDRNDVPTMVRQRMDMTSGVMAVLRPLNDPARAAPQTELSKPEHQVY